MAVTYFKYHDILLQTDFLTVGFRFILGHTVCMWVLLPSVLPFRFLHTKKIKKGSVAHIVKT